MAADNVGHQLQLINTKSQELLKRLEFNIDSDESLNTEEVTQLQSEREQLISHLFNQHPKGEIEKETQLINQMMSLDADLQVKTETLKQSFANKLIKIKKGKKSAQTYQKY